MLGLGGEVQGLQFLGGQRGGVQLSQFLGG